MDQAFTDNPKYSAWPFWALELTPSASLTDIESAHTRLSGKLALGVKSAATFATPRGPKPRDEYLLREAKAILMAPERRLIAEFWYCPPANEYEPDQAEHAEKQDLHRLLNVSRKRHH